MFSSKRGKGPEEALRIHEAVTIGDLKTLKKFYKRKPKNDKNTRRETPLHTACSHNQLEIVQWLLDYKKVDNINDEDDQGWTALHCACSNGYLDIIEVLLKYNASPVAQAKNFSVPLHYYVRLKVQPDKAAQYERIFRDMVKKPYLGTKKLDVNSQTARGETPLHGACMAGSLRAADLLLQFGATMSFVDKHGETALHVAVKSNSLAIVKLLVEKGIDVSVAGSHGTAREVADKVQAKEIAEYLDSVAQQQQRTQSPQQQQMPPGYQPPGGTMPSPQQQLPPQYYPPQGGTMQGASMQGGSGYYAPPAQQPMPYNPHSQQYGSYQYNPNTQQYPPAQQPYYPQPYSPQQQPHQPHPQGSFAHSPAAHTQYQHQQPPPSYAQQQALPAAKPLPSPPTAQHQPHQQPTPQSPQKSKKDADYPPIEGYHVAGVLGKGAFGCVYKAVDLKTGQMVAIKQMHLKGKSQKEKDEVMHELKLLNMLHHENIVNCLGVIESDGLISLVLEYIEGGTLTSLTRGNQGLPEQLIVRYIGQLMIGLEYLHSKGVVHRDIKGANILVTKDCTVKLADFGISQLEDGGDDVAGSPYWMAPEIITMQGAKPASDIWSLGCTVIELLTGAPPFSQMPSMAALHAMVEQTIEIPNDVSPHCKRFLARCFEKDPAKRASASELLRHRWLMGDAGQDTIRIDKDEMMDLLNNLSLAPPEEEPELNFALAKDRGAGAPARGGGGGGGGFRGAPRGGGGGARGGRGDGPPRGGRGAPRGGGRGGGGPRGRGAPRGGAGGAPRGGAQQQPPANNEPPPPYAEDDYTAPPPGDPPQAEEQRPLPPPYEEPEDDDDDDESDDEPEPADAQRMRAVRQATEMCGFFKTSIARGEVKHAVRLRKATYLQRKALKEQYPDDDDAKDARKQMTKLIQECDDLFSSEYSLADCDYEDDEGDDFDSDDDSDFEYEE